MQKGMQQHPHIKSTLAIHQVVVPEVFSVRVFFMLASGTNEILRVVREVVYQRVATDSYISWRFILITVRLLIVIVRHV